MRWPNIGFNQGACLRLWLARFLGACLMMTDRGSSSTAAATARPTGSEAIASGPSSQQPPLADTPASHLRNALAILELAPEYGTLARVAADLRKHISAALELLERDAKARANGELPRAPHQLDRELAEMIETNRQLRCPCGEMGVTECAGECGRLDRRGELEPAEG